ncbi:hypothetical protein BJX99DRAFT_226044 [Aspergillus californicus]
MASNDKGLEEIPDSTLPSSSPFHFIVRRGCIVARILLFAVWEKTGGENPAPPQLHQRRDSKTAVEIMDSANDGVYRPDRVQLR